MAFLVPAPIKDGFLKECVLHKMLHMPQLEAESDHCVKYCTNFKIQRELVHV